MPIPLNPNEKLTCTCLCFYCGGGRSTFRNRRWGVAGGQFSPVHCQNQQSGCGFQTTQTAVYAVY